MKKKRIIICVLIVIFCASVFSACGRSSPEKTVNDFFKALSDSDFEQAGEMLGDKTIYQELIDISSDRDSSYLEIVMNRAFVAFVYGNIKCQIISVNEQDDTCDVQAVITAYNINEIISLQQEKIAEYAASKEYTDMSSGERYVALCDQIGVIYENMAAELTPVSTEVTIHLTLKDNIWQITPEDALFAAIAGGAEQ